MNEFLKDVAGKGAIYSFGAAMNGLAGLVLVPFFVRRLSPSEYGAVATAEMLLVVLLIICGMGLNIAMLSRFAFTPPQHRSEIVRSLFSFVLITSPLISFSFLTPIWSNRERLAPGVTDEMFILVGLLAVLETVWLLFATQYRAEGAATKFVALSFLYSLVSALGTVILITRFDFRAEAILYGRIIAAIAVLTALLPSFAAYRPSWKLSPAIAVAKIGAPLIPAAIASVWIIVWPRYAVAVLGTKEDVAIFVMSVKVASIIQLVLVQPVSMVWPVVMFKIAKKVDASKIFMEFTTLYVAVSVALVCGLTLMSSYFAQLIGTARFSLSWPAIALTGLGFAFLGLGHMLNVGPYVLEKTRAVLFPYTVVAAFSTALSFILVPYSGVYGAALVFLLSCIVLAGLLYKASQTIYPLQINARKIARIVIAGAITVMVGFTINAQFHRLAPWIGVVFFETVFSFLAIHQLRLKDRKATD